MFKNKLCDKWNYFKLIIDSKKGPLEISWTDSDNLAFYVLFQAGCFGHETQIFSRQFFFNNVQKWYQDLWNLSENIGSYYSLPDGAKIIDVGSGASVIDLLLYSYVPDSKIYLLDKEEFTVNPGVFYSNDYYFYNSWEPVKDAITTSNFKQDRFNFLQPTDIWPKDVDMISSHFAWCLHFPKDKYWNNVLDSLKIGGILQLDVRPLEDRDIIGEISEDLKSTPKIFKFMNTIRNGTIMTDNFSQSDVLVNRCVWERQK